MILELDTSYLVAFDLSINQLVFVNLVLNKTQSKHQSVHELLSRVSDEDIQDLITRNIISVIETEDSKIYNLTNEFLDFKKQEDLSMFEQFYEVFPVYVHRPDGTKGFLRANVNKCRKEYNKIVGKSRAEHDRIMTCLKFELTNKMNTGKLGYMKTMWKWLTQHEWECYDDQIAEEFKIEESYGSKLY